MELALIKQPGGTLVPLDDGEAAKLSKVRAGAILRGEFTQMRHGSFFRKWWTLVGFAFDIWADQCPQQEYAGKQVLPDKERFRKDLTILAGFFRPVWNVKGELRVEAESLKWAEMTEERFQNLYSATVTVILQKIIPDAGYDEERLRSTVDQLLAGYA